MNDHKSQDNYETNDIVKLKSEAVHRAGATAVVCIGETLEERRAEKTLAVLQEQMLKSLPRNITPINTVVAYEPVWAIGTGLVPETDQIRSAHAFIRGFLASTYGAEAHNVKILYSQDQSKTIKTMLSSLQNNVIAAIILVLII